MKKDLFTISQVGKVCGISRSTILRLEDKGLLTPACCDRKSGYRYYDIHNITKILQIKAFQEMGLQYDDIAGYYGSGGDPSACVRTLEYKMSVLKRTLEEMKLWSDNKKHLSCEVIDIPDYVCYAREYTGMSYDDEYRDMYELCHEAFKKGYRMLATEQLFIIHKSDDFYLNITKDTELKYMCCIPLEPDCASEETVVIPGGKALSLLYYGNYETIKEDAPAFLAEKLRELGLNPAGYVRGLCIVAPYMGSEIGPDKYVSRVILPVKE